MTALLDINEWDEEDWIASELHFERNSNIVTAIESYLQQSPAVAVAVAVDDHVVYKKAVGHISTANRNEDTRVGTNDTAFLTASITKTFLALMTVQAMEMGILQLDQDINDFLTRAYDISFRNPYFPDVAITFRHLLTHSSSLDDNEHNLTQGSGWRTEGSDCTISLLEYVKQSYIDVSSPKYAPHVWNRHMAPGKARYHYSNAGFAVLGLALETATERSLQSFAQEYIFDPLYMNNTAFMLAEMESKDLLKHIALPHNEKNQPIDHYGVAEWPAAQLRTTLEDLTHYLLAFTGSSYPSQLLSNPESLSLLMPERMTEGLAWWGKESAYGDRRGRCWSHGGFMEGVRTHIYLWNHEPDGRKRGAIILANSCVDYDIISVAIENAILIE